MNTDERYMHRCLQLAKLGAGDVAPNPMVGAVLVYDGRIIGEGYHQQYGKAHAEVNCINSVAAEDRQFIAHATMYVSLEPCAHFGKTPPCADLLIREQVPKVVVGCRDPFKEVNGKGIERMQAAGIDVVSDVLRDKCFELNKRFFTFHTKHRPYIVLKWAQSINQKIGTVNGGRVLISNEFTNMMVHKWRSQEAGIMVGTNTALYDDPSLNTRHWPGRNPTRLVVDMNLRLPLSLNIFDKQQPTVIFNKLKHDEEGLVKYYQVTDDVSLVQQLVIGCRYLNIQSVLVEGGKMLLQSFIDEGMWDEARVITNKKLVIDDGLPAPQLTNQTLVDNESVLTDEIHFYKNKI